MKASLTPDSRNPLNAASPYWNNSDLLAKILYRARSHSKLLVRAMANGSSLKRIAITRAPYLFGDSAHPPSMHVEFTNACDLRCVYCNNPHFAHPRGMMSEATFDSLINGLRASRVDRLCMGGGEATLHPRFIEFARRLREEVRMLTIVTNGNWSRPGIAEALVTTPVDFIEVSVEAGSEEDFHAMRPASDRERIISNIKALRTLRDQHRSPSIINLRMMVRPSQRGAIERESLSFWKPLADSVMPQYVLKDDEITTIEDAYTPKSTAQGTYPKCGLPFRNMQVRHDGGVPVCQISGSSFNPEKRVWAGNVREQGIQEIWNGPVMQQYRKAHRQRDHARMPICRGCKGC